MLVLFVLNLSDGGRSPFHVLNGRVLYYRKVPMNLAEAEKFCNAIDGHLVSLHSDEEARELIELIDEAHDKIWLGAKPRAEHESGLYEWFDESPAYTIRTYWLYTLCNHGCCALALAKIGNDLDRYEVHHCSLKLPFICSTTTLSQILLNESAALIQQEFSKLKSTSDDLDTRLKGLSSKVSSLNDAVTDMKTKGKNSRALIDFINGQVTKLAGDASDMKNFSQHLTSKLHTMNADVSSKLSSLETKVNSMNVNSISEILALNGKLDIINVNVSSKFSNLNDNLDRVEEHLQWLSERINRTDGQITKLANASDLRNVSQHFTTKLHTMDADVSSKFSSLDAELERMEEHLERVSGRMNHTDVENRSTAELLRFLLSLICFLLVLLIFVQVIFFLSRSAFASKVCVTLFSFRSPLSPSKVYNIYSEPLSPGKGISGSPSLSATYSVSPENVALSSKQTERKQKEGETV